MMDIRQFGVQLGEYLYDCGVNIDQVKEITKIVEQIRQCAYEQGKNDMRNIFLDMLIEAVACPLTDGIEDGAS